MKRNLGSLIYSAFTVLVLSFVSWRLYHAPAQVEARLRRELGPLGEAIEATGCRQTPDGVTRADSIRLPARPVVSEGDLIQLRGLALRSATPRVGELTSWARRAIAGIRAPADAGTWTTRDAGAAIGCSLRAESASLRVEHGWIHDAGSARTAGRPGWNFEAWLPQRQPASEQGESSGGFYLRVDEVDVRAASFPAPGSHTIDRTLQRELELHDVEVVRAARGEALHLRASLGQGPWQGGTIELGIEREAIPRSGTLHVNGWSDLHNWVDILPEPLRRLERTLRLRGPSDVELRWTGALRETAVGDARAVWRGARAVRGTMRLFKSLATLPVGELELENVRGRIGLRDDEVVLGVSDASRGSAALDATLHGVDARLGGVVSRGSRGLFLSLSTFELARHEALVERLLALLEPSPLRMMLVRLHGARPRGRLGGVWEFADAAPDGGVNGESEHRTPAADRWSFAGEFEEFLAELPFLKRPLSGRFRCGGGSRLETITLLVEPVEWPLVGSIGARLEATRTAGGWRVDVSEPTAEGERDGTGEDAAVEDEDEDAGGKAAGDGEAGDDGDGNRDEAGESSVEGGNPLGLSAARPGQRHGSVTGSFELRQRNGGKAIITAAGELEGKDIELRLGGNALRGTIETLRATIAGGSVGWHIDVEGRLRGTEVRVAPSETAGGRTPGFARGRFSARLDPGAIQLRSLELFSSDQALRLAGEISWRGEGVAKGELVTSPRAAELEEATGERASGLWAELTEQGSTRLELRGDVHEATLRPVAPKPADDEERPGEAGGEDTPGAAGEASTSTKSP